MLLSDVVRHEETRDELCRLFGAPMVLGLLTTLLQAGQPLVQERALRTIALMARNQSTALQIVKSADILDTTLTLLGLEGPEQQSAHIAEAGLAGPHCTAQSSAWLAWQLICSAI